MGVGMGSSVAQTQSHMRTLPSQCLVYYKVGNAAPCNLALNSLRYVHTLNNIILYTYIRM